MSDDAKIAAETRSRQDVEKAAFDEAARAGDFDAYIAYLDANKTNPAYRAEAVERAKQQADEVNDAMIRDIAYDKLLAAAPEALLLFPLEQQVQYVGPPGMRVKDLLAMRIEGLGDDVIASKIATGNYAYKSFTLQELSALKKAGMPDNITKAMMESTATAAREETERRERDALKAEIASLRKLVEEHKSNPPPATATTGGNVVQTKDGPMDLAACIAARLLATQACNQIPWPGSTICAEGLTSAYPCE
jgi:hypothetical protein